jgi:hypothetical protein
MSANYRTRERHLKRFLSRLWKGDVLRVYHNILITHPYVTSEQIWEAMKLVVYNDSHVVVVRDRMYRPSYDHKKETAVQYGKGIKAAALSLVYCIPEKQLTTQFIQGLPARLRERAKLLSGPFDEIAEKMSRVAATAAANDQRLFAIEEQQGRPDKPPKPAREYI